TTRATARKCSVAGSPPAANSPRHPTRSACSRDHRAVDLLGRYSKPDNVARLHRILSGKGRDRPSHRPIPSLRQKQTRLVNSDRNEVLKRYQAGETANALAEAFDVNRATIFAILQRAGIKGRYGLLTDRDVLAATELYESGRSLASIARYFEVSDRTVLNA